MALDTPTIVGLVLSVLGLWGLPTFWRSILYASRVPRQRTKINARISNRLDALRNTHSGNHRSVDGFEVRLKDIERRYHKCYTEMTCAHTTRACLMWIVWCFLADPYLSKLFSLEEELSSLLKQIEDYNNLGNILTEAVNTTERASGVPSRTSTHTSPNSATILSIGGTSRDFHVHQPTERYQNTNSSGVGFPYISSISTRPHPTSKGSYNDSADFSVLAVSDRTLTGCRDGRSLGNREVAESSPAPRPTGIKENVDSCLLPSEPIPSLDISRPRSRDPRGHEHRPSLHSETTFRRSDGIDGDIPASGAKDLPIKPATSDSSDVPASRDTSQAAVSAVTVPNSSGTSAADSQWSSPSSNQQNGMQVPHPSKANQTYNLSPAAANLYRAFSALYHASTARAHTYPDAYRTYTLLSRGDALIDPIVADALTSDDEDDIHDAIHTFFIDSARSLTADADTARTLADAANAANAVLALHNSESTRAKPSEIKPAAPDAETNKKPEKTWVRAKL